MKGPDIFVFIFSVLYLIGIYSGFRDRNKGGLQILFWCTISLIIYLIGVTNFYDEVRRASTHGNTIHGWYSKSNGSEKAMATFWGIGFPIITNGLLLLYIYYRPEKHKEQKPNESNGVVQKLMDDLNSSWNDLDDKWKKILNFNISKPNIIFTDNSKSLNDIKPSEINNLIEHQGIVEKPNPNELEQIISLKEINLYLKKLTDLKPLKYLSNLESLNVGFNEKISDFNPVSDLVKLKILHLNYAFKNFSNLYLIKNLVKLEELYINNNSIIDIQELSNLKELRILDISSNQITNLKPLSSHINLRKLYLKRNPLTVESVNELRKKLPNCEIEFE
jgi:hypothetical protein